MVASQKAGVESGDKDINPMAAVSADVSGRKRKRGEMEMQPRKRRVVAEGREFARTRTRRGSEDGNADAMEVSSVVGAPTPMFASFL